MILRHPISYVHDLVSSCDIPRLSIANIHTRTAIRRHVHMCEWLSEFVMYEFLPVTIIVTYVKTIMVSSVHDSVSSCDIPRLSIAIIVSYIKTIIISYVHDSVSSCDIPRLSIANNYTRTAIRRRLHMCKWLNEFVIYKFLPVAIDMQMKAWVRDIRILTSDTAPCAHVRMTQWVREIRMSTCDCNSIICTWLSEFVIFQDCQLLKTTHAQGYQVHMCKWLNEFVLYEFLPVTIIVAYVNDSVSSWNSKTFWPCQLLTTAHAQGCSTICTYANEWVSSWHKDSYQRCLTITRAGIRRHRTFANEKVSSWHKDSYQRCLTS